MVAQENIDFKKIEWHKVDNVKARFIYDEALAYSRGILEDIKKLNDKAFGFLAFVLPLFSAVVGFLIAIWENKNMSGVIVPCLVLCCGLFAVLVLLVTAVFPRNIFRSENPPCSYFTGNFYKVEMLKIYSCAIASIQKYINHNHRVMRFRGKFLTAAVIMLLATPLITITVFLIRTLNP